MTGVAKQSFASPFRRKKATLNRSLFVRIKGLEPPRLSASDPKSDVATNYTISAGSILLENHQEGSNETPLTSHRAVQS